MGTIISLSTPNLDWEVLARTVERTGVPLWLELDGTIQGVLLTAHDAEQLMGRYVQTLHTTEDAAPRERTSLTI